MDPVTARFVSLLVEQTQKEQLEAFKNAAREEGFIPIGTGFYNQKLLIFDTPFAFVLSQTEEQRRKQQERGNNTFTGRIYDFGGIAGVEGRVTSEDIAFSKQYEDQRVNPNPIFYTGIAHTYEDNKVYTGVWNFIPSPDTDMESDGHFLLRPEKEIFSEEFYNA